MSASANLPSDGHAVLDSIRQIVHSLATGSHTAKKTVGLSGAQLFVLQTLAAVGVMSVNELAAKTHTHQSSVSVVVSRLVARNLVKRGASSTDARRLELSVTPAGRRLLKAKIVTPQERLLAALDRLSSDRLASLRALLADVVSFSGMDSETPPMFFEPDVKAPRKSVSKPTRK